MTLRFEQYACLSVLEREADQPPAADGNREYPASILFLSEPMSETVQRRRLWINRPLEVLAWRGYEPTFHIRHLLCTGLFSTPVGMVGKQGRLLMNEDLISNNPELHSRVLENRA
jgi:hypothetical protein